MPKIFGTSLLGIIAATIVFYVLGILIYGIVFSEQWLAFAGMTEAQAMARNEELGPLMYVWGFAITLAQVLGLSFVLNHASASQLGTCTKICAMIAVFFALPVMAYNWLYQGSSGNLLGLDFVHLLVGYSLAGIVMSFFRGKDPIGG